MTTWLDRSVHLNGPYLALCLSEEAFNEALLQIKARTGNGWAPEGGARTHVFDHEGGSPTCIVCVRGWQGADPVGVAAMLVHEAVHVWQIHAENIGERAPGMEQEAYAIQWISEELMREFVRQMGERA